jgi:hypothetical protein
LRGEAVSLPYSPKYENSIKRSVVVSNMKSLGQPPARNAKNWRFYTLSVCSILDFVCLSIGSA